eukprot:3407694-Prymnesium_polylepis.1
MQNGLRRATTSSTAERSRQPVATRARAVPAHRRLLSCAALTSAPLTKTPDGDDTRTPQPLGAP